LLKWNSFDKELPISVTREKFRETGKEIKESIRKANLAAKYVRINGENDKQKLKLTTISET